MKKSNLAMKLDALDECIEMHEKRCEQIKEPYFKELESHNVIFLKEYRDLLLTSTDGKKQSVNRDNTTVRRRIIIAMAVIVVVQAGLLAFQTWKGTYLGPAIWALCVPVVLLNVVSRQF